MNYKDVRDQDLSRIPGKRNNLIPVLQRQVKQLRAEGPTALVRKLQIIVRFMPQLPAVILALPVVLVVRLLRPVIVIRFGPVRSANFGHFASEPEVYLSKRELGLDNTRSFDIQYYSNRPQGLPFSNKQLKTMWDRTLRMNRLARWPDWLNRSIPGGAAHMVPPGNTRDIHGTLTLTDPHISFTDEEEKLGRDGLRGLGIPDDAPFVGFHARDSAWLQQLAPKLDFRYHDHRDSDIQTYLPSVQKLVDRGYYAVRMGSVVKHRLEGTSDWIIDYATNGTRTDFLDVYLSAKCAFFLGSAAGTTELPKIFRRPILSANQIPLEYTHSWSPNDLFIPKKLWLRSEGRLITFHEILESGLGAILDGSVYEDRGIDIIENTIDEINDAVLEIEARIQGTWQPEAEDDDLQARFWRTFEDMPVHYGGGEPLHGVIAARIGANYLRQNRELLG